MYDVYRHINRSEFRLTVLQGKGLPREASKASWRLIANRKIVPKIVSEEIARTGFSVTRPKSPTA